MSSSVVLLLENYTETDGMHTPSTKSA